MPKERKMPHRDELEVYVESDGSIVLSQEQPSDTDRAMVCIHPEDVDRLIDLLKDARDEALAKE